jgi:hypothetical protein
MMKVNGESKKHRMGSHFFTCTEFTFECYNITKGVNNGFA